MDRVLARIIYTNRCWFWGGGHGGNGRPYYQNQLVYRLTYEHFRGPIPRGAVLDHIICDNPKCINPYHLKATTQRDNLLRANCANNLGALLGFTGRERNTLGQFTGG